MGRVSGDLEEPSNRVIRGLRMWKVLVGRKTANSFLAYAMQRADSGPQTSCICHSSSD